MATGQRTNNTYEEWLRKQLSQIADAKTLPDANLEQLVNWETQILGQIRAPIDQMQQQGATGVPGAPSMMPGMPPGLPPGTPTSMPAMGMGGPAGVAPNGIMAPGGPRPPGVNGVMQRPGPLPPELLRMLGGAR